MQALRLLPANGSFRNFDCRVGDSSNADSIRSLFASVTSVAAVCFYVHERYIAILRNPDGSEFLYRIVESKVHSGAGAENIGHGALFDCKNHEACVMAVLAYVAQVLNDVDWEKICSTRGKRRSIPTSSIVYEASIILNSGPTVEQPMKKGLERIQEPSHSVGATSGGVVDCVDVQEALVTEDAGRKRSAHF